MDVSLDDYIREKKNVPRTDLSLDEYIHMNNVPKPIQSQNCQEYSGVSKFDRYKNQDEIDEEMEDGNYSIESHSTDGLSNQMPKLVPFQQNTMPKKKPIHTRLGERGSVCESIHTSQMKLFRPNIFKAKVSVQKRLGKNYSNPAMNERNRITLHTLNSIANKASKNNMLHDDRLLFNTLTKRIGYNAEPDPEPEPKYNMKIQKEISYLQGKELHYACPGAFVVSSDGPGLRGVIKVPNHQTNISMNQRFA